MTETKKRPRTAAQIKAERKYAASTRVDVRLTLFRTTDADIIAKLEEVTAGGQSKRAFLKQCIREHMNK